MVFIQIIRRVVESLNYIERLDPATQIIIRESYKDAVHVTLWFSVILAACALVSSFLIKEKHLDAKQ
jgi:type VI protein secretion system component VasF